MKLCRSRSAQTSNTVGCSQRWAAAVTVSFPQRSEDRSGGFKETPQRDKNSGRGHGFVVEPQCPSLRKPHAGQSKKLSSKKI